MAFYREDVFEAPVRNNRKKQTCPLPTSLRLSGQDYKVTATFTRMINSVRLASYCLMRKRKCEQRTDKERPKE